MSDVAALAASLRSAEVVDLSQTLEEQIPAFLNHAKYFHNLWGAPWLGTRSLNYQLVMSEHSGTHVDAPAHFFNESKPQTHVTIEHVAPGRLLGRGARLDCRDMKAGDYVSREFIRGWEEKHGALAPDDIVIFNFGWSARWKLRPQDVEYAQDWPGVSHEAATYLVEKSVAALGVDTLSPDPPAALASNPIHPFVLEKHVLIIENLTNLERLPDFFLFVAVPLKIKEGSGSPIRALALV
jgi:kynurenine formamidase